MPKIEIIGNLLNYKGSEPVFEQMKNVAGQIVKEVLLNEEMKLK